MEIFAVSLDKNTQVKIKVVEDMGIEIHHGKRKKVFRIFEDNLGNLILRSEDQLVIYPEASNTIKLNGG